MIKKKEVEQVYKDNDLIYHREKFEEKEDPKLLKELAYTVMIFSLILLIPLAGGWIAVTVTNAINQEVRR